ncbi:MAG TPA: tetratricopeptide repeat protein [Candidatus Polarisedimenticolia bacterium]|jgi:tetratricopeptide (TPR) repeat protein|nr:tetratricopeptide repeat protein [Candidatus Polarisedimenticolia bacterium]
MRPPALAITLLILACGVTTAHASTARELFEKGNGAYEQGRYEEAAAAYEKILGYGVIDPRVLYNLGNAHFKMGRLGAAILNYERALRLDPADRDVRDNLEYARGLIRDRVAEAEIPYPVQVVRSFIDGLPADLLTVLFLIVLYAAAGLLGLLPLTESYGARRALGYGAACAALATVVIGTALGYSIDQKTAGRAIVMEDKVDVLSGPAADNTVLFTVHEGARLELRNRRDGWYQVSLPNAMSGWVPSAAVEKV